MTNAIPLSARDRSLLRFLSWTPLTTTLLMAASRTFDGGPFSDERRLRERLHTLEEAGFTRHWSTATIGGGLQNYYKLSPSGFQAMFGHDVPQPPRAFFAPTAPSHFAHTQKLAEVIVQTVCAAHNRHVTINRTYRENELSLSMGEESVQPDCFFRFTTGGRPFNVAFEVDMSTETVDSPLDKSLRSRLQLYDAYQDQLLRDWITAGRKWERPRYRVVFLTPTVQRAYHILAVSRDIARVPGRRLVLAATHDAYLGQPDPLFAPEFVDHRGQWHALINLHPTSTSERTPAEIPLIGHSPLIW